MKIGLFGGTFDPIHKAHIALADAAVKEVGLDELYFMPAYVSPFKIGVKTESGDHRYNMIHEILHYNDAFRVSSYELLKQDVSYTFDTLTHLKKVFQCDIYFILGYDSLVQLDTWYKGDQLLSEFPIVAGKRPGTKSDLAASKIKEYQEEYNADIRVLEMAEMDIAATDIRECITQNEPISDYVVPEVEEYIIDNKLYQ